MNQTEKMSLSNNALFIIERNLNGDLTLGGIAQHCGVSHFHLAHAFGKSSGSTVMDYVRARRLTVAANALASGARNILDLALEAGYSSHEAFSRAFKAQFRTTPDEVRKNGSVNGLALVDPMRYLRPKHANVPEPRSEAAGTLLCVGLSEVLKYGDTQKIAGQWQRFMSGPYDDIPHKAPSIPVGITTDEEVGRMRHVCAAEVTRFGATPKGLTDITLAPQAYLVFEHDGHITQLDDMYDAIWDEWLPAHDKQPIQAPSLQRHNATFDPSTGYGGVTIWVPVVA